MMQNQLKKNTLQSLGLFLGLFAAVLIASAPILIKDAMYQEQPTMYLVNQSIHSWLDLLNIYLHPKLLDITIPFFRPSGHFLLYQILTPIVGWHNTRALLLVNFLFLTGVGFLTIKLYQRLFPTYRWGGYIAFGIYLMHPALLLSRFMLLHFEFAYVFFLMLGLYFFVIFCQKNAAKITSPTQKIQFSYFSWLVYTLLAYGIGITFKEGAIILGPLLLTYFFIEFYRQLNNKQSWEIIILLIAATGVFSTYLTMAWPLLGHPFQPSLTLLERMAVINQYVKDLLGIRINLITSAALVNENGRIWRHLVFAKSFYIILYPFLLVGIVNVMRMIVTKGCYNIRSSIIFLSAAMVITLMIPVYWGMALPWHWNLSILFLGMLLGLGVEYFIRQLVLKPIMQKSIYSIILTSFIMVAIQLNAINLNSFLREDTGMPVTRAAIFNPPNIRAQLNSESIILIATNIDQAAYSFGNSKFDYLSIPDLDFDWVRLSNAMMYRQFDPYYNGTLFKWAYLIPELREELFLFNVDAMQHVQSFSIWRWHQALANIFCFSADKDFTWHNETDQFKKNLRHEFDQRHLQYNDYDAYYAEKSHGMVFQKLKVNYPDSQLCQFVCDQNIICKAFLYKSEEVNHHLITHCELYNTLTTQKPSEFCPSCTMYIKT